MPDWEDVAIIVVVVFLVLLVVERTALRDIVRPAPGPNTAY